MSPFTFATSLPDSKRKNQITPLPYKPQHTVAYLLVKSLLDTHWGALNPIFSFIPNFVSLHSHWAKNELHQINYGVKQVVRKRLMLSNLTSSWWSWICFWVIFCEIVAWHALLEYSEPRIYLCLLNYITIQLKTSFIVKNYVINY